MDVPQLITVFGVIFMGLATIFGLGVFVGYRMRMNDERPHGH